MCSGRLCLRSDFLGTQEWGRINANYSSSTRPCLLYTCSQGFIRLQLTLTRENYHICDGSLLLHFPYRMGEMYLEPEKSSPEKMSSTILFSWAQNWAETVCLWRSCGFSACGEIPSNSASSNRFIETGQETFEFYLGRTSIFICYKTVTYLENCKIMLLHIDFHAGILNVVFWVPRSPLTNQPTIMATCCLMLFLNLLYPFQNLLSPKSSLMGQGRINAKVEWVTATTT